VKDKAFLIIASCFLSSALFLVRFKELSGRWELDETVRFHWQFSYNAYKSYRIGDWKKNNDSCCNDEFCTLAVECLTCFR